MLVNKNRINKINEAELEAGEYVAYWMQSSQRLEYNQALGYAVEKANRLNQPLVIFFLIKADFPEAEYGHFKFIFEGLQEIKDRTDSIGLNFYIFEYQDDNSILEVLTNASLLVSEKVYLKNLKDWKYSLVENLDIPVYFIESNLICPVEEVTDKEEYAAYTIRKKINSIKDEYLKKYKREDLKNKKEVKIKKKTLKEIYNLEQYLEKMSFKNKKSYEKYFKGGYQAAKKKLDLFINNKLKDYDEKRNIPHLNYQSDLSPYLHFGQISAQEAALAAQNSSYNSESFLEELIVRRELAFNFVYYNQDYDKNLKSILSDWAVETIKEHRNDEREYLYEYQELEEAKTHDKYWNAAQKEMLITGKMHNYMRMYWGKKILEWTPDPETGFQWTLTLNNKYSLDGRDPNSYAGVAWCYSKHDRAWKEREIFGKIRYMNANGLERKFDMQKYIDKVNKLELD